MDCYLVSDIITLTILFLGNRVRGRAIGMVRTGGRRGARRGGRRIGGGRGRGRGGARPMAEQDEVLRGKHAC